MAFKDKLISHLVSFKIYILLVATVLLCKGYIEPAIWRDVIIALTAARATLEGITAFRETKQYPSPVEK